MSDAWVIDASPLILFARIGRLDLFERLTRDIIVPDAVCDEVRAGHPKDASAPIALDWAGPHRAPDLSIPATVERWDLGRGESQVITHGALGSRWVVLDDRAGRRCAVAHGLAVIGSLGVILLAKERQLIEEARPWVERLIAAGMFVGPDLRDRALSMVGE